MLIQYLVSFFHWPFPNCAAKLEKMHKLEKRRVAQHSNIADVTPAVSSTAQTSSSPGTPSAALLSSFQTQPTPRAVAVAFPVDNYDTTSETSGPQLLRMPLSRTLTPVGTTLSFD